MIKGGSLASNGSSANGPDTLRKVLGEIGHEVVEANGRKLTHWAYNI